MIRRSMPVARCRVARQRARRARAEKRAVRTDHQVDTVGVLFDLVGAHRGHPADRVAVEQDEGAGDAQAQRHLGVADASPQLLPAVVIGEGLFLGRSLGDAERSAARRVAARAAQMMKSRTVWRVDRPVASHWSRVR